MTTEDKVIRMFGGAAPYLSASRRPIQKELKGMLTKALEGAQVSRFLDVGCGIGFLSDALCELFPKAKGTGVDASEALISIAKKESQSGARYEHGNVYDLKFRDCSLDLTTCQTLFIHLSDPSLALKEMIRVTRPGGRLLIIEPIIHKDGFIGFVPGDGGKKKELRDDLFHFDFSKKEEAGIDMMVATKIPYLLLQEDATDIVVGSHTIISFSEKDRSVPDSPLEHSSYDQFMLDLGYEKSVLEQLRQIENQFQSVKGELSVVTLLVISGRVCSNSPNKTVEATPDGAPHL